MKKIFTILILIALITCGVYASDPGSVRGGSVTWDTVGAAYYDYQSSGVVLPINDSSNNMGNDASIQFFVPAAIGQADTINISATCTTNFSGHGSISFKWLGVGTYNKNISGTTVSHTFSNQSADQTPLFRIWVTGIAPEQGERVYVQSVTFTIDGTTYTVNF
jgi:hypothetical protein